MDYYTACSALGVAPGADMTQIKNAYRKLSKRFHPDNADSGDTERFTAVSEAYSFLEKLYDGSVYAAVSKTTMSQSVRQSKVIGGAVTSHPGSQEVRDRRRSFELKAKAEDERKKQKARQELEERREKLQEEKAQRKKEKDILNEIRMIRLAHAIEALLTSEAEK